MALPKKQKPKDLIRINSFTHEPLNMEVKENQIVKIKDICKYDLYNDAGESIPCYKVRGDNGDDYLVSYSFQNQIGICDAIQYQRMPWVSLYMGEYLMDPATEMILSDEGYAWVPVVSEFIK